MTRDESGLDPDAVELTVDGATYSIVLPDRDRDYIQGRVAERRVPYEHEMLRDMAARLSPGDVVIDAGANIGNHTMYLASVVGCRVDAFEPDSALTAALGRSVGLNGLAEKVTVFTDALGAVVGRGDLVNTDQSNIGGQHIVPGAEGGVKIVPLDGAAVRRPVRAIKVDVEGMELDVLRGGMDLIREDRPLLYVECGDEASFGAVAALLDDMGFAYWETFNATPTHLFLPAEGIAPDVLSRRLLFKTVRDGYRAADKVRELRGRLDQANLKYRGTTQAFAALRGEHTELVQRAAALEAAAVSSSDRDSARAEVDGLRADLEIAHSDTEAVRTELLAAATRFGDTTLLLARADEQLSLAESERDEARVREAELAQAVSLLSDQVEVSQGDVQSARRDLDAAREDLARARAELGTSHGRRPPRAVEPTAAPRRERAAEPGRALHTLVEEAQCLRVEAARLRAEQQSTLRDVISMASARRAAAESVAAALAAVTTERDDALRRERVALAANREVRGSVTFRAGKVFRAAASSPSGALTLPARLWRLSREARRGGRIIEGRALGVPVSTTASASAPRRVSVTLTAGTGPLAVTPCDAVVATRTRLAEGHHLRIAAIVDEFTGLSLAPDCELNHLTPSGWLGELEATPPDLLFVESAWRGKDGVWHNAVGRLGVELRGILAWCAAQGVPTVFWNKEDPVHFATFLTTARAFDHVFTTDIDCIGRYKSLLGHDRVYLLPFACQPRVQHPLEEEPRKDAFSFAGSYYRRYPNRTRDLDSFLEHLPEFRPLDIFDRNLGSTDENYAFPEAYQQHIVGMLPPDEMARAYKGYRFGINLNSVTQSQTMFARRVFELLASNTVTVSNFSRGIRLFFGDLVVTTDSGEEAVRRLAELDRDGDRLDRLRLAGLRSVMSQHTYADRLAYVASKALGVPVSDAVPVIALVGRARTQHEAEAFAASVRSQRGVRCRGVLVTDPGVETVEHEDITVLRTDTLGETTVADVVADALLVGVLHPEDYYGPHYVFDLALARRYSDADVLGKRTRFRSDTAGVGLVEPGSEYRHVDALPIRSSLAAVTLVAARNVLELVDAAEAGVHEAGTSVALDRFGYCEGGAASTTREIAELVDDLDLWPGVSMAELQLRAEAIPAATSPGDDSPSLTAERLAEWFAGRSRPHIRQSITDAGWRIDSSLDDEAHDYLYATLPVPVSELWAGDRAQAYVETTLGLRLQLVFLFTDASGQRVGTFFAPAQQNAAAAIPDGAVAVQVGIRVQGRGSGEVSRVVLGAVVTEPTTIIPTARDLVLTNHYPAYDDLYRNAFVHSRLRAYGERGARAEVFRLRPSAALRFGEFEGVDVVTGGAGAFQALLAGGEHRSVLIHFLDRAMWDALDGLDESIRVVIWVHGAEVQPWWRRAYNYRTDVELEAAKPASDERLALWREVFAAESRNLHFVFVSEYFADEVMTDVGVRLDPERFSIIHNPIDVGIFQYIPKPPEQRLRVLSIRPFASAKYANDLTVAAIEMLSGEPGFDELEFRIIGDGELFDETLAPLRGMSNVQIERGFLTQPEIAALHREYGVFLVPTRMDAQGVSRDEAMASGLVPISNSVAAVPEFVDASSGLLVDGEDARGLANAVQRLRDDPQLFRDLSANAAERVRRQSAAGAIIARELALVVDGAKMDRATDGLEE